MDKRIFLLAAGVVLVAGVTLYEQADDVPAPAILAAGMEPQIALIREIASDESWKVTCEGQSGEMTVLRLEPRFWAKEENSGKVFESLSAVATGLEKRSSSKGGCELNSTTTVDGGPTDDPPLALGTRKVLEPYLEIARSCGLADARISPLSNSDRERLSAFVDESELGDLALFGGIGTLSRYGPARCFAIMSGRYDAENLP